MRYVLAILGSIVILFGCFAMSGENEALGSSGALMFIVGIAIALVGAILAVRSRNKGQNQ